MTNDPLLHWLLQGDPAIRWQVRRDLLGAGEDALTAERQRVAAEGWGARLLACQDAAGTWGGQLYNGKWLSTTYTLLLLRQMGLDPANPQARLGCKALLEGGFRAGGAISYAKTVDVVDLGVVGMVLSILAYFAYPDARVHAVADYLVRQQLPDGRWEPVSGNTLNPYTFDCTLLALEGLREYEKRYPETAAGAAQAQAGGRAFLLRHRLYQLEQGGRLVPIHPNALRFSFPPRWHFDVLFALDYFQECRAAPDERLGDAIDLLRARRAANGCWNLQNRHPGKTFFEMEEVGQPSRWNTLRALRVLRWWEGR